MARRRLTPAHKDPLAAAGPLTAPSRSLAPIAQVSGQSAEAAALREVTEGLEAARREGRMVLDVPLSDIDQTYLLRDRIDFEPEELAALKRSIFDHGQRTPAEITPLEPDDQGYRFGLISGWRRLTALRELFEETRNARFAVLRALVRPAEEVGDSYVAMVEENEIRVGLSYYERARVTAESAARGVFPDQATALKRLFAAASRAKRSKISSFILLYEALDSHLRFPAEIPERLGLALVAHIRAHGADAICRALEQARADTAKAEMELLSRMLRGDVSRAKPAMEQIADGVCLSVRRKGQGAQLTLTGAGVDDAWLSRAIAALRNLEG